MKIKFTFFFLFFLLSIQLFAHSGKPKYHLIIDTDGATDDMRALTTFLAMDDTRVLAISCSQGVLLPDTVFTKVTSLVSDLHCEGVPVGKSTATGDKIPEWSKLSQQLKWGNKPKGFFDRQTAINPVELYNKVSNSYKYKITLIALGSLKNFADWINSDSTIIQKIDKIIWYNNANLEEGFNYGLSSDSYEYITNTGIQLDIVYNRPDRHAINEKYKLFINQSESVYAKKINSSLVQLEALKKMQYHPLTMMDDLIPIYLAYPLIFDTKKQGDVSSVSVTKGIPEDFIYESVSSLLSSSDETNNRVFSTFPIDTSLYKPDYAKIVSQTIEDYGAIEWKAICMTNEIHGHTGIYSIIGAKMGVRAMEYFNVGINNMEVTTYAGNKPPLSCLNDGIQISSGCTIGQGLIKIADSISDIPTVVFEFNQQKIRISIEPRIAKQIREDIRYGVKTYGLLSEQYWVYIEELAIKYWSTYNRHEIFEYEVL